jgi:hypothetical protein
MSSDLSIRRAGACRICATIALAGGVGHSAWAAERPAEGRPYAVVCDYRASWGHDDEFIRLYRKNHHLVLKELMEEGRILKLPAVTPRSHAAEEGRWGRFEILQAHWDVPVEDVALEE